MEVSFSYPNDLDAGSPQTIIVHLSPEALDAVRLKFNPSGMMDVTNLKVVAALLYELNISTQNKKPEAGREAAVAKTNIQTASMWGVLAATKGL